MARQVAKFVNPVLVALKRLGGSARPKEVCAVVAHDMGLEGSPVLEKTLKSGGSWFENNVAWVRQYFVWAGIIDGSERGIWTLTEKGRNTKPFSDDEANEFAVEMHRLNTIRRGKIVSDAKDGQPEEEDESGGIGPEEEEEEDESKYKSQLLEIVRGLSPKGFELLCRHLLRKSGFEQADVTGGPRDKGIDGIGILRVSPVVTLKVLFQCKRYAAQVSPSEVRDFRGAMQGRAEKGIILTTGTFSAEAEKEAVRDGAPPIELVDGERLVGLCEDLELGLVPKKTYEVDPAFFSQFDSDANDAL